LENVIIIRGGDVMKRLGDLIKAKRLSMGLSLREFGDMCGLSHSYIRKLEEGDPRTKKDVIPTLYSLEKIANILSTTIQELLKDIGFIDADSNIYKSRLPRHIKQDLKSFIAEPSNEQYLKLAKELKEKNLKVDFLRKALFDE
jgi:transcriptional regulator with XRE-family HTH domain